MTRRSAPCSLPERMTRGLVSVLLLSLAATPPLLAASAKDLYTAALTHERQLRAPTDDPPTLAQFRAAIDAYTEVVRAYPRSGYSDNALWQAAGLAALAFDRHRQPADRASAEKFLSLLEQEYPSSSLVSRVADRLGEIGGRDTLVQLRAIHREPLDDIVRVTIELDDEVRYTTQRLDGPARVYFDFSGTHPAPSLHDATLSFDDGDMIRKIRLGRHPGAITRVVLDIEDAEDYSVYSLYNPYRLVIDAVPTASMQARRSPPDAAAPRTAAADTGPAPIDEPDAASLLDAATDVPAGETRTQARNASPPSASDDWGPPANGGPTAAVDAVTPIDPDPAEVAAPESPHPGTQKLARVPDGWQARRLDPIPPPELVTADSLETPTAIAAEHPTPAPEPTVVELMPVSLDVRQATSDGPEAGDAPLRQVVDERLDPDLGAPRLPEPADAEGALADVTTLPPLVTDDTEWFSEALFHVPSPVAVATLVIPVPTVETPPSPQIEWFSDTPFYRHGAVAPAIFALTAAPSTVAAFPLVEPAPHTAVPLPSPATPPVATVIAESVLYAESLVGTETPSANSSGDFSLGRQLGLGISRVVLDPGHGGYDPGAQTGTLTESALVLDIATRLEARLEAETDIEVILTRRDDAYLPLRARTDVANSVGADLFLSIHANAASDRSAGGIETYYLDLATDPDAQRVAARENASFREGMHDLPTLVRSITMRNKQDESRDLAETVQRNLVGAMRELHPGVQDLGVKQAPFVVLIDANMPSVLAEISFLTNQEDAAFLATDAYRDQIADALLRSILEYQRTLKPPTSFAAGNNN